MELYGTIARAMFERDAYSAVAVPSHRAPGEWVDGPAVRATLTEVLGDLLPVRASGNEAEMDAIVAMLNVGLRQFDLGYYYGLKEAYGDDEPEWVERTWDEWGR
jgi:hypothetical protein